MATREPIVKQPAERYPFSIDFTDRLPAGCTLASATAAAILVEDGSDASSELLYSTTLSVSGDEVILALKGGVDGKQYKVTVQALLSQGSPVYLLEDDFIVNVKAA